MDLIAAAGCLFGLVLMLYRLPQYWRNEYGADYDRPPAWFPLGIAVWRGGPRILPLGLPAAFIAIPFLVAEQFEIEGLRLALAVPGGVIIVLIYSVFLFNRPKWVVAPHLRHQPGAIREWLGAPVDPTPPPAKLFHKPGPRRRS